jgi:hypothetical protein
MTFYFGPFKCEIFEGLLIISNLHQIIIRYYYEPGRYLVEYIKSTIVPDLIRKWVEAQLAP